MRKFEKIVEIHELFELTYEERGVIRGSGGPNSDVIGLHVKAKAFADWEDLEIFLKGLNPNTTKILEAVKVIDLTAQAKGIVERVGQGY